MARASRSSSVVASATVRSSTALWYAALAFMGARLPPRRREIQTQCLAAHFRLPLGAVLRQPQGRPGGRARHGNVAWHARSWHVLGSRQAGRWRLGFGFGLGRGARRDRLDGVAEPGAL